MIKESKHLPQHRRLIDFSSMEAVREAYEEHGYPMGLDVLCELSNSTGMSMQYIEHLVETKFYQ